MSRSGYSEDCDDTWALIRWRGAVAAGIKSKRGQSFLREAIGALDAMPDKRLTADSLHEPVTGGYCTLGVVGAARGMNLDDLKHSEREGIAEAFGISNALAAEIMWENDGDDWDSANIKPEKRWANMRHWMATKIKETP